MDEDANEFPSMGEWFKKYGYYTISNGKITHIKEDSPECWSDLLGDLKMIGGLSNRKY